MSRVQLAGNVPNLEEAPDFCGRLAPHEVSPGYTNSISSQSLEGWAPGLAQGAR